MSEDNVAAPPFFIKASYICEFIGGSSSGPPQTARLKRGALPPAGQARGQKARYPPPHSLRIPAVLCVPVHSCYILVFWSHRRTIP